MQVYNDWAERWENIDDDADDNDLSAYFAEYCDYCERDGHTFSACPARDDFYDA